MGQDAPLKDFASYLTDQCHQAMPDTSNGHFLINKTSLKGYLSILKKKIRFFIFHKKAFYPTSEVKRPPHGAKRPPGGHFTLLYKLQLSDIFASFTRHIAVIWSFRYYMLDTQKLRMCKHVCQMQVISMINY